ncbi:MAG: amidohydrolase family protein [Chloroflexi bacterium]|nr:amidohydrolase family protein [Anaerolineaceae bacterium]NMB88824.1 amidohydrolase family protein [Chloroflexota bacterium]
MDDMVQAENNQLDRPEPDEVTVLKNARILDVIHGRYLDPETSIFIKNGKIVALSGDETSLIEPDVVYDLQGKTVLPGLINSHCHISRDLTALLLNPKNIKNYRQNKQAQLEKSLAECLERGVTQLRDGYAEDLRITRDLRRRIEEGEIRGPRIQQAVVVTNEGGSLTPRQNLMERYTFGRNGIPSLDNHDVNCGVVVFPVHGSPNKVREAVNRAIEERGADCIKIYEDREAAPTKKLQPFASSIMKITQMQALVDQARLRGVPTLMHHATVESFRRAVEVRPTSLVHLPMDEALSEEDVCDFAGSGTVLEPTLSLVYGYALRLGDGDAGQDERMRQFEEYRSQTIDRLVDEFWLPELSDAIREYVTRVGDHSLKQLGSLNLTRVFKQYSDRLWNGIDNLKQLWDAGVPMACGNDAGSVAICTPAMVGHELALLAYFLGEDAGRAVDAAELVRAVTIRGAQACGLEDSLGSIEIGKTADLVIMEGDPLADWRRLGSRVDALFMDGKLVVNHCELEPRVAYVA